MPKEKSINPAQAQRKAEKKQAIKKGKAQIAQQRSARLATRNPSRIESQISDLRAIESSGGKLTSHEKSVLEGLERDLKAVVKAKAAAGDVKSAATGRREGETGAGRQKDGGGVLGKRTRDGPSRVDREESTEDEEIVDEETKRIPMPRDTPPPFPKDVLDRWWARRRARLGLPPRGRGTDANTVPIGAKDRMPGARRTQDSSETAAEMEAKTVYEAKPMVRNLRKDAAAFVPAAVRTKMERGKGNTAQGALVEPEELDRLEEEGYAFLAQGGQGEEGERGEGLRRPTMTLEDVVDEDG